MRLKLENPKRIAKTLDLKQSKEEEKSVVEESGLEISPLEGDYELDLTSFKLLEQVLEKQEEINSRL